VRKSGGTLQEFDIRKIKLVLERVSDECSESMNASDVKIVSLSIQRAAEEKFGDEIGHKDLRIVVRDILQQHGFGDVANCYMQGRTASDE